MVFNFAMTMRKTFPGVNSSVGFENIASIIKEAGGSQWAGLTLLCCDVSQPFKKNRKAHLSHINLDP